MTLRRRTLSLLALSAVSALAFAGCASAAAPTTSGEGTPSPSVSSPPPALQVEAGWLDDGRQIALVTWGSSTCVPTASQVTVEDDGAIAVTLDNGDPNAACTADYAARVTLVSVPSDVDISRGVDVVVTGGEGERGTVGLHGFETLSVGSPTDYQPSAGWIQKDLFAVLTWGSSSCAPKVEAVEAPLPSNIDVTFVKPPKNQVCTMDMVPRTLLVSTADLEVGEHATVTLRGGDAQFEEKPAVVRILAN